MRVSDRVLLLAWVGLLSGICGTARADHSPGIFSSTSAGPISFLSADTIVHGCWAFGAHTEYTDLRPHTDDELTEFTLQGFDAENVAFTSVTFVSVGYGVTEDFTLMGRLPYAHQDNIRQPENQGGTIVLEDEGDASGIGDFLLLGILKLWDSESRDVRISAILGLEAPTGRTDDDTLQLDQFAFEHQAGSRSWDPLGGLAVSVGQEGLSFHATVTYLYTTESHRGTNLGDVFNYNAGAVYRISDGADYPHHGEPCPLDGSRQPRHVCSCHPGRSLDLIAEFNGTWQDKNVLDGAVDHDSGGHLLLFSPGLRYTHHEPWCIYSSCGIPILQEQNGVNREVNLRITLGAIITY